MSEWRDSITARCTKAVPGQPSIVVGGEYKVNRNRTSPAEVTCQVMLPGGIHRMDLTVFNQHFVKA